ncbi:hypothetical protein [Photobacterium leiognathi]|uniref:hypothetical protein n=1 Tax=Photobacterium leiognathi TaxID=553611 RepID=UPI0029823FE0|nr:hypothetical protein [Photobacterium leiognathi]
MMNRNSEEELLKRKNIRDWLVSIPLIYIFSFLSSLIMYAGIKSVLSLLELKIQFLSDNFLLTFCIVLAFGVATTGLYLMKPRYK